MSKFTIRFAVYLILQKDHQICLSLRQNTGFMDNFYSLIAGHVDGKETATTALLREALEEANIIPINPKLICTMHRNNPDGFEYLDLFFIANKWEGELKNNEPSKCGELKWFNLENLPENTIPYVADVLKSIQDGHTYYEYGWPDHQKN